MIRLGNTARIASLVPTLLLGGLSLSGCVTEKYVTEHITEVNTRVSAVDAKASDALQRADAASAAAQAAAADARSANERLDQLTPRVDRLEQGPMRTPRN